MRFQNPVRDWNQPRYLFDGECDVLFLDLRLWEDEDTIKRGDVIKQILDAATKLLGATQPVCVSPNFAQAFNAAKRTTSQTSDEFPPEALTLLPLLLSHIDRTLPIVLFTSSHQRVVSEMLRDRPNIIATFVKPLIIGYGKEISPTDSVRDLEDAIREAIRLHDARIAWKRICELEAKDVWFGYEYGVVGNVGVSVQFNGKEEEIRPRLARIFETCVFGNSVYEAISKPWEFLERNFRNSPDAKNIKYDQILTIGAFMVDKERNRVAFALKLTQNAKVHCELEEDSFENVEAGRVALLQLLFLLDFLAETCQQEYAGHKEKAVTRSRSKGPEYVLRILANQVRKPETRMFLHRETEAAMRKLLAEYGLSYGARISQYEMSLEGGM